MPASGGKLRAMVIGEGPGRNEDIAGRPFVGRAGQLLDATLARAFKRTRQQVRQDIWVTNAVKCRPPRNRTPFHSEIDTCVDLYLMKEIVEIVPRVILACGNAALYALFRVDGVTKYRGVWLTAAAIPVMVTYHPAYISYQGLDSEAGEDFKKDVAAFAAKAKSTRP